MKLQFTVPKEDRLKAIYGTFSLIIKHNDYQVKIGRGSFSVLSALHFYPRLNTHDNLLARIGNFCEFADCKLILGGEHPSERPVHVTFGASLEILLMNDHELFKPATKGRITIGPCCVAGVRTTILSGSVIGDNSTVAAGAVVTGHQPSNAVIAGVPGKRIKPRLAQDVYVKLCKNPWWTASYDWIANCLQDIQVGKDPKYAYQPDPYSEVSLVLAATMNNGFISGIQLMGWEYKNIFCEKKTNAQGGSRVH